MKQLYPTLLLLFLLAFTLQCSKKFDYEYATVCEIPAFTGEKQVLIVTAEDGTLLKEIPVPQGVSSINEKFELSQSKPNELLNLHLIQITSYDVDQKVRVLSHYGVRNGQSVDLNDREGILFLPSARKNIQVTITDLPPQEKVEFPGCGYSEINHSPSYTSFSVSLFEGQGMIVYLQNPDNLTRRTLYISGTAVTDSVVVSADQFKPLSQKLIVQFPSPLSSWIIDKVTAVSPNSQNHVFLWGPDHMQEYDLPAGIDPTWDYYVSYNNASNFLEQFFPPGGSIQLMHPVIGIDGKSSVPGQSIAVKCSGPVDWLDASSQVSIGEKELVWRVMGSATAFEHLELPSAVKKYMPEALWADIFKTYDVRAFRAPAHGYDGMAAGFPWKSTEPFAAGRQGYEVVYK